MQIICRLRQLVAVSFALNQVAVRCGLSMVAARSDLRGILHAAVAAPPTTPGRRREAPPPAAESTVVAGINAQEWGAMGVPFAAVDVLGSEDGAVLAVCLKYNIVFVLNCCRHEALHLHFHVGSVTQCLLIA